MTDKDDLNDDFNNFKHFIINKSELRKKSFLQNKFNNFGKVTCPTTIPSRQTDGIQQKKNENKNKTKKIKSEENVTII